MKYNQDNEMTLGSPENQYLAAGVGNGMECIILDLPNRDLAFALENAAIKSSEIIVDEDLSLFISNSASWKFDDVFDNGKQYEAMTVVCHKELSAFAYLYFSSPLYAVSFMLGCQRKGAEIFEDGIGCIKIVVGRDLACDLISSI